ncbi:MAG TPA: DNA-formamidopyrimidine glycosylase family protein [Acidimicrobiales bacterium]|nr:DNA-formamidopyrimidine glycosylase family protein [Acidimicrobiales bacterium]
MPELPEVEALASYLTSQLEGRVIDAVEVVAFSALKTFQPPAESLVGRTVVGVSRHGKFLDFDCSGLRVVVHLSRGGWIRWVEAPSATRARPGRGPLALRLRVSGGQAVDFTEAGTKKRLAVYVVTDPAEVPGVARLGIDPLDPGFTVAALTALVSASNGQIKGLLTDQSVLAGVGNAYSDEALHRARLSPFKTASRLSPDEIERLHQGLTSSLGEALERARGLAGAELKDDKRAGLQVHGRTGLPCPVCGDTVREVAFAEKSLQYCPTCQTGGKPLADRRLSRLLK